MARETLAPRSGEGDFKRPRYLSVCPFVANIKVQQLGMMQ